MDDAFELELATTTLLGDGRDVRMMLGVLAGQLAGPLGERLRVQRRGGVFRKSDEIRSLTASIGADEYTASLDGPAVQCTIGRSSGGIRIRSEKVAMEEWLGRLLRSLKEEAAHSEAARTALEKILIGET